MEIEGGPANTFGYDQFSSLLLFSICFLPTSKNVLIRLLSLTRVGGGKTYRIGGLNSGGQERRECKFSSLNV